MKAVILGSGSAVPDPFRGNPSCAVIVDGEVLLFDCGERTTVNLTMANINPMIVDHLFITHIHRDHVSDYGYFVMTCRTCGRNRTLKVFGPPGTKQFSDATIFQAYKFDIDYVTRYSEALPPHIKDRPIPIPSVDVREIDAGFEYEAEDGSFRVIAGAVEHHQRVGVESVAYRVESKYGTVAISGDTRPCESMIELARGADLLIHEATFLEETIEQRQMWSHSGPEGAGRVAAAAGVGRLVLTHLGPYTSTDAAVDMASAFYGGRRPPEVWNQFVNDARRHFSGPVLLAYDGMVIEVDKNRPPESQPA